jgi:hypothetical protein
MNLFFFLDRDILITRMSSLPSYGGKKFTRSCIMKKIFSTVVLALLGITLIVSCVTTDNSSGRSAQPVKQERKVPSRVPDFVKQAIMNAPEDALVGIGMAKMAMESQSMTIAQTRARAEISRQMNTMIQDMVRDYQASSEADPTAALAFQENITVALSKSTLTGSRAVAMDFDDNGTCWVVMQLGKTNVVQEITQAQAAAKLSVPAMASFNAEDRMNAAFDKAYGQEVQVGSN